MPALRFLLARQPVRILPPLPAISTAFSDNPDKIRTPPLPPATESGEGVLGRHTPPGRGQGHLCGGGDLTGWLPGWGRRRPLPGVAFNPWGKHREMPAVPKQTFRQWYIENRRKA